MEAISMQRDGRRRWRGGAAVAALALAAAAASPAAAQTAPADSLAINLTRLLVKQGVITQEAADALIAQAQRETGEAIAAGPGTAPIASHLPPPAAGATRIPYVPEIVKNQIRDEVKEEVLADARTQRWAAPNAYPDWVKRIEWGGDLRLRDEYDLYDGNNTNDLVDFASFNANGPVDVNPSTNPAGVPQLDTRRDRFNDLSLRARLSMVATLSDQVQVGVRLASGATNSPVSTTQLLGGGLDKKDFWLDRAYVTLRPTPWAGATLGRMPNPFFSTDLVYDEDLNFDGAVAKLSRVLLPQHGVSVIGTAGAIALDYQSTNFPTNSPDKQGNKVKWLFGYQVEADWFTDQFKLRVGGAYYDYRDVRGTLSEPCALYSGVNQCSTDFTRPAFMQKGNTLFLIRDIIPDPSSPLNYAQPQYAGLAFDYNILNFTANLDYNLYRKHLVFTGDWARNLAYDPSTICRYSVSGLPVTNIQASAAGNTDPCSTPAAGDTKARLVSGADAWKARLLYGDVSPARFGEWNVIFGYKHIAADSLLDAYTDSDFHLGGTNAEGYFLIGTVGLFQGVNLQGRWFSANEVSGPPLAIDVAQVDLNVRF